MAGGSGSGSDRNDVYDADVVVEEGNNGGGSGGGGGTEDIVTEVISASLGGAVSASILYPLEVLKTKMQASTSSSSSSSSKGEDRNDDDDDDKDYYEGDDEQEEGEDDDTEVVSNEAGDDGKSRKSKKKGKKSATSAKKKATAEAGEKKKTTTMVSYGTELYRREGLGVFYNGVATSAMQSALEKALYFFAYASLKSIRSSIVGRDRQLDTATNLLLGCLAEWAHLPITLPVDAWTTRIQTTTTDGGSGSGGGGGGNKGSLALLLVMLGEHRDGTNNLYNGISAYTVLCFKPALQYTVYEQIKNLVLLRRRGGRGGGGVARGRDGDELSATEAFLLGMFARTVSTVLVFPFLRAKVIMQTTKSKTEAEGDGGQGDQVKQRQKQQSTVELLMSLYKSEGFCSGLYRGIGPELTRGIFSAALMLMIKEKISSTVRKAVVTTAGTSKQKIKY